MEEPKESKPLSQPADASAEPVKQRISRRKRWAAAAGDKGNWFTRWFFGVVKEFRRIQWLKPRDMAEALLVVIVTVLIIIALLAAVDAIFLDGNILA